MSRLKRWLCPWIAALAIACVAAVGEVPHALAAPPSLEAFAGVVGGVLGGASVAPEVCDGAAFVPVEMTFYPQVFLHLKVPRGGISECGYEGGTSHVTEVAGPISASHSLGPAASQPYTGSAKAVASYRTLRAEARSEMSGDFDPLGSFPRGDASGAALFEDALTATSAALPAGSPGFVRYVFTIDGTLTSGNSTTGHVGGASVALHLEHVDTGLSPARLPARIFAAEAIADYTPMILIRDGGHGTFVVDAGLVSGGGTFTSAFVWDGDTFDLPIHFGAPFWLKVGLVVSTRFVGHADFAMTARLVELQFFDAAGNPVDDVSIVSASGTSYDACASPPCPTFRWVSSEWSACSATCGDVGVQVRTVECRDEEGQLAPDACTDPQPPTTRVCRCDSRWGEWSPWSECSQPWCGGSTMRTRQCLYQDGSSAPESECASFGPGIEVRDCNDFYCPSSGSFEWVTRVVSECSATCGGGTEMLDAACVDSTGQAVSDSSCTSPKPPLVQQCNTQPCLTFRWGAWSPWSACSQPWCGGSTMRTRQCLYQDGSPAPQSECATFGPGIEVRDCNDFYCPSFGSFEWVTRVVSECSATCGGGTEVLDAACVDSTGQAVPDSSCTSPKPLLVQQCNTQPCPTFGWVSSEWSVCSALCGGGVQMRTVECRDEQGHLAPGACTDPQPPTTRLCNDGSCDSRWGVWSEWGPCSAWCGGGVTTRTRQCLRHDGTSAPESECVAAGPGTEMRECALVPCPSSESFEWVTLVVSECSATCGGGTEVLDAACVDSTGQAVSDSSCTSPKPPLVQQCNTQPCPTFGWFSSEWSACSALCGGGFQMRVVQCGDQSGQPAAESDCTNPMPPTTQFCNTHACPESTWVSGPWSECSATCGGGVRTRDVVCLDRDIRIVPETSCEGLPRPLTAQACSTDPCATPTHSYAAHVQPPIHADHSSVFRANRGVVPGRFALSDNGHPTCDLPPATIALTRTTGGTDAQVNEPDHTGPPDSGSNFRIDGCEYVYNLKTSALGVGSYWVGIIIDGQVVGSAIFSLK